MNTTAITVYLCWLCEELVNLLLRPVWRRYVGALDVGLGEAAFRRFLRLVDAANCWPCCIEFSRGGALQIFSGDACEIEDDFPAGFFA